jgi:hypothetical protein
MIEVVLSCVQDQKHYEFMLAAILQSIRWYMTAVQVM